MVALVPEMAAILDLLAQDPDPPLSTQTPEAARRQSERFAARWRPGPRALQTEERSLPGPAGPLRVRIYDPGVAAPAPALLYIHGGGWVLCSLDTHDSLCRQLAADAGVRVVSLDYRLAPEHPFPAAPEDCVAAARWLRQHGADWGLDPERLAIGGDSAGGNLALATLTALRDAGEDGLRAGLLLYGALSADLDTPSHRQFGDGSFFLSTADMAWFWDHYVPEPARRRDPLAAPLLANLAGLPPLLVTAAEADPLLDDSARLAARLKEAGQPHEYVVWPGLTHACLHMIAEIPAVGGHIAAAAAFLRRHLVPNSAGAVTTPD